MIIKLAGKVTFILALVFSLVSCDVSDLDDVDELDELLEYCEAESLTELMTQDTISEECKEFIRPSLPDPEDNIRDQIFMTGIRSSGPLELFFSVTDEQGNRKNIEADDLTVIEVDDETENEVALTEENLALADDFNISISLITDYSGSMSRSDIDDAVDLMNQFTVIEGFTDRIEANHIIFSGEVETIFDFTDEPEIAFEENFQRSSTRLYDGLGAGIESLASRTNPGRVLILFTDGGENDSWDYDYEEIVSLANENNVLVILMGSLVADLNFLKNYSSDTGGLYLFVKEIPDLEDDILQAATLLSGENYKLTLENDNANAQSVRVSYEGKTIEYTIP